MDDADRARAEYAELLARIGKGCRTAEGELLQKLQLPLKAILRNRTGNTALADDLCQEVLIVVLRAARDGSLKEPAALFEFALGTARRQLLNGERKKLRQRTDNQEEVIEATAHDAPSAASEIEAAQLRKRVKDVVAAMPNTRDRQLLYAYYLQEKSSSEVQAFHEIDSMQLARVLHRARKRFAALWKKTHPTDGEWT